MTTTIKIALACPYCGAPVWWLQSAIELRGKVRPWVREGTIRDDIRCPACDSTFNVDLVTKRKRQGKRYRALVAEQKADLETRLAAAIKHNRAEEARLLSEPGCTCGDRIAQRAHWLRDRERIGHRLASVTWDGDGIPRPPKHDRECPVALDLDYRNFKHWTGRGKE